VGWASARVSAPASQPALGSRNSSRESEGACPELGVRSTSDPKLQLPKCTAVKAGCVFIPLLTTGTLLRSSEYRKTASLTTQELRTLHSIPFSCRMVSSSAPEPTVPSAEFPEDINCGRALWRGSLILRWRQIGGTRWFWPHSSGNSVTI
jgi:hypothetical protein